MIDDSTDRDPRDGLGDVGPGDDLDEASADFGRHPDDLTDTTVPEDPAEDGTVEAGTRLDDELSESGDDELAAESMSKQTVTNDAVAGQTVFPSAGIRDEGPTGGATGETEPIYDEHDSPDGHSSS